MSERKRILRVTVTEEDGTPVFIGRISDGDYLHLFQSLGKPTIVRLRATSDLALIEEPK